MVPSKKMRGYVQLSTNGNSDFCMMRSDSFTYLQGGSIGGPVDCVIDIGKNGQLMRVHGIDSNNANDTGDQIQSFRQRQEVILFCLKKVHGVW